MYTTLPIGSSSHDRWGTFTSNGVFSKFSFRINVTKGFEDVVTSFAMIGSSSTSTKNKRVAETTKLILAFEGGLMILFSKLR